MKTAKIFFQNGDYLTTRINGTDQEIKDYYKTGRVFNLGTGENGKPEDVLTSVKRLEFLNN